jgi:hypothetical protein
MIVPLRSLARVVSSSLLQPIYTGALSTKRQLAFFPRMPQKDRLIWIDCEVRLDYNLSVMYKGRLGPGLLFFNKKAWPYNFDRKEPYPGPFISFWAGPFPALKESFDEIFL